jgi:hypothetical protein
LKEEMDEGGGYSQIMANQLANSSLSCLASILVPNHQLKKYRYNSQKLLLNKYFTLLSEKIENSVDNIKQPKIIHASKLPLSGNMNQKDPLDNSLLTVCRCAADIASNTAKVGRV